MPRGVPTNGYRMTKKRQAQENMIQAPPIMQETYAQAEERIREAFSILDEMTSMCIDGTCRSLIVSGPPGLGKSHRIIQEVEQNAEQYSVTKGYCKATGLYRLLWKNRNPGSVIVFDDCDSILFEETSLNFLKAACDTTDERIISYSAEFDMTDDSGETIPREFVFEGSIIFISNIDFDAMIEKGHKLAPHLAAMVSRSHYIDLGMKSKRDYLIRIKHAVEDGALENKGLTETEQTEVLDFINKNAETLRELSIRIVLKVADIRSSNNPRWERIANATCVRNR